MEKALEFAVLIKDKKATHLITILTVVPNNKEAEKNIVKAKQSLEQFAREATASETFAMVAATIDFNASAGIVRTARETIADVIVLGWPQKAGFIDKLIGEKMENILNHTENILFNCHFQKPLASHKRLMVVVPTFGELEKGFRQWMRKICTLSSELSAPIHFYCSKETEGHIKDYIVVLKVNIKITFAKLANWDDFLIISREVKPDDIFFLFGPKR